MARKKIAQLHFVLDGSFIQSLSMKSSDSVSFTEVVAEGDMDKSVARVWDWRQRLDLSAHAHCTALRSYFIARDGRIGLMPGGVMGEGIRQAP
mmetsp:Transcript_41923/g.132177  ORF Transcript_41923/g.132177 Transcript_41923/m.132177 type:complete len:93 (+) Transcript_41923:292-570(+)